MYLVVIAWLYVTLMMAVAEATNTTGSLLGAFITFVFYGLLPAGLLVYIFGTPARKRALREREAQQQQEQEASQARAATAAPSDDAPPAPGTAVAAAAATAAAAGLADSSRVQPDTGGEPPAAP